MITIYELVYVIGLHAVQLRNNCTAKVERASRPSLIWQSEEFFKSNYFLIGQHGVPLPINYIAAKFIPCQQQLSN